MSDRDEIIGIVLDALADDACSYGAASKAADRIVALRAAPQGAGEVEREVITWLRDRITQLEEQYIDLKAQLLEVRAARAGTEG